MGFLKNGEQEKAIKVLALSLFFAIISFAPFGLPPEIFLIFFPAFIVGLIFAFIFYSKSLELSCLFTGDGLLAVWEYSPDGQIEEITEHLAIRQQTLNRQPANEVRIGKTGAVYADNFHAWDMGGNRLSNVEIALDGGKFLEITYNSSFGFLATILRIPIPEGEELTAKRIVEYFNSGEGLRMMLR